MDWKNIEQRWMRYWADNHIYETPKQPKNPLYLLEMFAYPSGDIHMGHFRNYSIGDAIYRFNRLKKRQILHPFGWDAFGLPAEQAAIKRGIHPKTWTLGNISTGRSTLQRMGLSYDWEREILTCDPSYYKWTQWLFLLLYKRGLAYKGKSSVNWCETCKTILANEQAESGKCWRCNNKVIRKDLDNCWFFKITAYAERLLKDIDKLDQWPENVKAIQRNWIGKSEGAEVAFKIAGSDEAINIFTTRLDTVFGVTFLTLAPEHPLAAKLISADRRREVGAYTASALNKSELDRTSQTAKTGVFTGSYAINPFTSERVPVWISDYVLMSYGTGAVMGVPAHDERDFEFAKKYSLGIKKVVFAAEEVVSECFTGEGVLQDSGMFSGLSSADAREAMVRHAEKQGFGSRKINYRIRDWLVSRQRYWGAPIPIVYCDKCGDVPENEESLPVLLPDDVVEFIPKGRSPLENSAKFLNVPCPKCSAPARRCSDTMDTFVCSSFYLFRYLSPHDDREFCRASEAKKWLPVSLYIGGVEHASGHLLYFRFITKVLYDAGILPVEEPVIRLFNHGMVLDTHGDIMSKSKGNVVSPAEILDQHGIDVSRLTMFFSAPSGQEVRWNPNFIRGVTRFYIRFESMIDDLIRAAAASSRAEQGDLSPPFVALKRKLHCVIKHVSASFEKDFSFNTSIARLMELVNLYESCKESLKPSNGSEAGVLKELAVDSVVLLAPFAPIIAEELWQRLGNHPSILENATWPEYSPEWAVEQVEEVPVQINGKLRAQLPVEGSPGDDELKDNCLKLDNISRHIGGKTVVKCIVIRDKATSSPKLVNLVVK